MATEVDFDTRVLGVRMGDAADDAEARAWDEHDYPWEFDGSLE